MKMRIGAVRFPGSEAMVVRVSCGCGHDASWPVVANTNGHLLYASAKDGRETPRYIVEGVRALNAMRELFPSRVETDEVEYESECPAQAAAWDANAYQVLALRTAANLGGPKPENLAIIALGLAGEAGEVCGIVRLPPFRDDSSREKLEKELGDVLWYVAVGAYHLDFSLAEVQETTAPDAAGSPDVAEAGADLFIEAAHICDHVKKVLGHGHALDRAKIRKHLAWMLVLLGGFDIPIAKIAASNIEKLKARYPEGFSTERSMNRGAS